MINDHSMNNLKTELVEVFSHSLKTVTSDSAHTLHNLISDNLITNISCNYKLCSTHLSDFSNTFNTLLNSKSGSNYSIIKAFILEDEKIFQKIESIFLHEGWSSNPVVDKFNLATHNTSYAKCTIDGLFYIIKCYDHFWYMYNTESSQCLMVVRNEKKALTMINILLLTPYLASGDLYAVHGGLVSDGKNNILISNSSLGGKTTFALLFLENGWQIITEENTYITKYGQILNYNIRNYFNIRVGTFLEFQDLFVKAGIINNVFLNMAQMHKNELFEFGKKEQMSIYFDVLCKNRVVLINDHITHVINVSLERNKPDIIIKKNNPASVVDSFLEISSAPTVLLFKDLMVINNHHEENDKEELIKIFKNIKSYSVSSGLDYKKNFDILIQQIKL